MEFSMISLFVVTGLGVVVLLVFFIKVRELKIELLKARAEEAKVRLELEAAQKNLEAARKQRAELKAWLTPIDTIKTITDSRRQLIYLKAVFEEIKASGSPSLSALASRFLGKIEMRLLELEGGANSRFN